MGHVAARTVAVRTSPDSPDARRAIELAVAGATIIASAVAAGQILRADRAFIGQAEEICHRRTARNGGKGLGAQKLAGGRGHDCPHLGATLDESPREVRGLVGGYTPRNTEDDVSPGKHLPTRLPLPPALRARFG